MGRIKSFSEYEESKNVNEFFNLGKLANAFFSKLSKDISKPIKDKVSDISKSIDAKAGKIKAKELTNALSSSLDTISTEATTAIKNAKDEDGFKTAFKAFINNLKTVFVSANIPVGGFFKDQNKFIWNPTPANESVYYGGLENINEKFNKFLGSMEKDFTELLQSTDANKFETLLDEFIESWIGEFGKQYSFSDTADLEKSKTEFEGFAKELVDSFKMKISKLSPEDLSKIVLNKKSASATDIDLKNAKEVETDAGKAQIMKAVEAAIKGNEQMLKIPGKEKGTYDIIIKGVQV
jgi:hypothetical protein